MAADRPRDADRARPSMRRLGTVRTVAGPIVVHHVCGPVDVPRVSAYINRNIARWADRPVIWNLSEAELADVSFEAWLAALPATEVAARQRAGMRTALVSTQALHDGLLRAMEYVARGRSFPVTLRAFGSVAEAEAWLLDEPPVAESAVVEPPRPTGAGRSGTGDATGAWDATEAGDAADV